MTVVGTVFSRVVAVAEVCVSAGCPIEWGGVSGGAGVVELVVLVVVCLAFGEIVAVGQVEIEVVVVGGRASPTPLLVLMVRLMA